MGVGLLWILVIVGYTDHFSQVVTKYLSIPIHKMTWDALNMEYETVSIILYFNKRTPEAASSNE